MHNKIALDKKNMWYLYNGASDHICGDKDKFIELNESISGNVTFANHSKFVMKRKERAWDSRINDNEIYDFLLLLDEENEG